jgi:hypothetical protein
MTFVINTADLPQDVKREPIFTIDGVEFTIPVELGAEVGMQATKIAHEKGEIAMTMFVVEKTIGMAAFEALSNVPNLPKSTFSGIMRVCREKVFGGTEEEGKD